MTQSRAVRERAFNNRILNSLRAETLDALRPHLEVTQSKSGQCLEAANAPTRTFYFVERGMVSLVKVMQDGRTVEIGAVGSEGVADPTRILDGGRAFLESIVQVPGAIAAIPAGVLRERMERDADLLQLMHRYASIAINAFVQTAACNALHSLEERCCRWLLIAHDSALDDTFSLTHEFLAMMLGVRRASVSLSASILARAGLIEYRHGKVTIVNREALERAACECYRAIRTEYDELLGAPRSRRAQGGLGGSAGNRADALGDRGIV